MSNYRGRLEIHLVEVADLKNVSLLDKMDPYVVVAVGTKDDTRVEYKTETKKDAGKHAVYNKTFVFNLIGTESLLKVRVYDDNTVKDTKIGSEWYKLEDIVAHNGLERWLPITISGDKPAGKVKLTAKFAGTDAMGNEIGIEHKFDAKKTREFVEKEWNASIEKTIAEYIKVPNQSPLFDPEWNTNGLQDKAMKIITDWVEEQKVEGLKWQLIKEDDRTPLLFIEIDGNDSDETVFMYGHMDKQPPMTDSWSAEFGDPWTPTIVDGKMYGRGGADDGYSCFAAVTAVKALKAQKVKIARTVILIEGCEESGSRDLPHYVDQLKEQIGNPSLIVCLDSGCGNYEQFWLTTSLRGAFVGTLRVDHLTEGVHSGASSGLVASSFRTLRVLLDRVEDSATGVCKVDACHVEIPEEHVSYAKDNAKTLGSAVWDQLPTLQGVKPVSDDHAELLLNKTWRPTVCVTGVDGIPALQDAGNVLRTHTAVKLSVRLPPTCNGDAASAAFKEILEKDPPNGAHVSFQVEKAASGWTAPKLEPWVKNAVDNASNAFFSKPARFHGEGGSIPFMGMLGEKFPGVQFVITGVLGPKSNAHGPNEFLHIDFTKGLIAGIASILADHYKHFHKK